MGSNMNRRLQKLESNSDFGSEILPEYVRALYHQHFSPQEVHALLNDIRWAETVFQAHGKSIFNIPISPEAQAEVDSIMESLLGYKWRG